MDSFLDEFYSSVKYHSYRRHVLTSAAKTHWNSIWWIVLLGLYPPKK